MAIHPDSENTGVHAARDIPVRCQSACGIQYISFHLHPQKLNCARSPYMPYQVPADNNCRKVLSHKLHCHPTSPDMPHSYRHTLHPPFLSGTHASDSRPLSSGNHRKQTDNNIRFPHHRECKVPRSICVRRQADVCQNTDPHRFFHLLWGG